jgi:hypothetical protein
MHRFDARKPSKTAACRRWITRATLLAAACVALLQPASRALGAALPDVPPDLEVGPGFKLFRMEHAVGTQNYICIPKVGGGFEWAAFGPQATLFSNYERQTMTHYLSSNPDENGKARPTWQDSRDSSAVWAEPVVIYDQPDYVDPDAIPWLKLETRGTEPGPHGGGRLVRTAYIQRINTVGGKAPATGCSEAAHVKNKALVPYETDYVFYKNIARD